MSGEEVDIPTLNEFQRKALEAYVALLEFKQYSSNTIRSYRTAFTSFIIAFPHTRPSTLSKQQIMDWMLEQQKSRNWTESYQNMMINAIKFFYEQLLKKPKENYNLPRPRKPSKLPSILSIDEVINLFEQIENTKHRAILMAAYSSGLRLSEVLNLKPEDIDSKRMMIHVRQAKGKKDRYVMLSQLFLEDAREYFKRYKPKEFLFEGLNGGKYSPRSVQQIIKRAVQRAKIRKKVTFHTLRHCFATHLLESGIDIRSIQELLGHNSIKTTAIYTHVTASDIAKIKSPLDNMQFRKK
jgi:site-specific recombinase XerD